MLQDSPEVRKDLLDHPEQYGFRWSIVGQDKAMPLKTPAAEGGASIVTDAPYLIITDLALWAETEGEAEHFEGNQARLRNDALSGYKTKGRYEPMQGKDRTELRNHLLGRLLFGIATSFVLKEVPVPERETLLGTKFLIRGPDDELAYQQQMLADCAELNFDKKTVERMRTAQGW